MHCAIVNIEGFGTSKPLQHVVEQLQRLLAVPMLVYLDGDQYKEKSPPQITYLPDVEVENLLLRDVTAVRKVLLEDNPTMEDTERDLTSMGPAFPSHKLPPSDPTIGGSPCLVSSPVVQRKS